MTSEKVVGNIDYRLESAHFGNLKMNERSRKHYFYYINSENKKSQKPYAVLHLPETIYELKQHLLVMFRPQDRKKITDLKIISDGVPNLFSKQYENCNCYDTFTNFARALEKEDEKGIPPIFCNFTVIQKNLHIQLYKNDGSHVKFDLPLSFRDEVRDIIGSIKEKFPEAKNISLFLENESMDDIEYLEKTTPNFALKDIDPTNLIAYLYPIEISIKYEDKDMKYICKSTTETVEHVIYAALSNLSISYESYETFQLKYNGNALHRSRHIHQFLRKKENTSINYEIITVKSPEKPLSILVDTTYQQIEFRLIIPQIEGLTFMQLIKQYFGIDKFDLKSEAGELVDLSTQIKDVSSAKFVLTSKTPLIQIQRKFEIDSHVITLSILLNSTIQDILLLIASFTKHDISCLSLSVKGITLKSSELFASYCINPEQVVTVNIKEIEKYDIVINKSTKAYPERISLKAPINLTIGEIQKMAHLSEKSILLYDHNKLDFKSLISTIGRDIMANNTIEAYDCGLFGFEYQDQIKYFANKEKASSIYPVIKSVFQIPTSQSIFLVHNNILIKDDEPFNKFEVGEIFHIRFKSKLTVDTTINKKKYSVQVDNTSQGIELYEQLTRELNDDQYEFKLISPRYKEILPDGFLFNYFPDQGTEFKIITKQLINITVFSLPYLKFMNIQIIETDKPSQIKEICSKHRQLSTTYNGKADDKSLYIIFKGRVLDDDKPLNDQIDIKDLDEEPLFISDQESSLITISLDFKDSEKIEIQLLSGTLVVTLRSTLSDHMKQPPEKIVLKSNGELLYDDMKLNENMTIDVEICATFQNSDYRLNLLTTTRKFLQTDYHSSKSKHTRSTTTDPSQYSNGVFRKSPLDDTQYIYKFKYNHANEFELEMSKEATVKEVKNIISDMRYENGDSTAGEDFIIYLGDSRLNDFIVLSELTIPVSVKYFTVRIVNTLEESQAY